MDYDFETDLFNFVKRECRKYKVNFRYSFKDHIDCEGYPVAGYFDCENQPTLKFAKGKEDWIFVLSHEYCHMMQWVENTKIWKRYTKSPVNLTEWLDGKNFKKSSVKSTILRTLYVEQECEIKSLKLLESFGYKNKKEYCKKGNSYIIWYLDLLEKRKWTKPNHAPYSIDKVWKKFPDTFDIDIFETYNKLKHLYKECY